MTSLRKRPATRLALILCLVSALAACAAKPERTLPADASGLSPWGTLAQDAQGLFFSRHPGYTAILRNRLEDYQRRHPGKPIEQRALLISGGGLRGQYGAGVLAGWSESGRRPVFDIVTGVSVGALMAPFVFLGSDYDQLLLQSASDAIDVFKSRRARPQPLRSGSPYVGREFARLLEERLTPALIDAVAREYLQGRRLFVGSTNLDGRSFAIWDLGMIAASDRPNRYQVFRRAILASASVPLLFPPVMFDLHTEQGSFQQMHIDGGIIHNVFLADYDTDWMQVMEQLSLQFDAFASDIYVIHNGHLTPGPRQPPIKNSMFPVLGAALKSLFTQNAENGIYKLWLMAMIHGARFHLVSVPPQLSLTGNMISVDTAETAFLRDQGMARGRTGTPWHTQLPPTNYDQLQELIGGEPLENAFQRSFYQQHLRSSDRLKAR